LRGSNERIGSGGTFTYTLARVNPFRTSARFGLIGVVVAAILVVLDLWLAERLAEAMGR
jgi:hypothetical protein